jgi:hypothetical protein
MQARHAGGFVPPRNRSFLNGRPTALWSAIDCEYTQLTEEEVAEPEEYPEEETWSA